MTIPIFRNNAIRHPLRALLIVWRRILLNRNANDPLWDGGAIPTALQVFTVGETLPWKGVQFKIGKVIGGDFPMVILVPVDRTRGAKLQTIRHFRDVSRAARKEA